MAVMMLIGCQHTPEVEIATHACASLPQGRASACACALGNKAYVFAGRDAHSFFLHDLWEYDATTDVWTSLGTAPMPARVNATMASYGNALYVGLGYSAHKAYVDTAYLRDWWEYTPATDTWRRLADFPNSNTVAAVSFAQNGAVYVLYGFGHVYSSDVCRYDIATDTWTTLPANDARAKENFGGRGALFDGWFYYGTGYATCNLTQWYAVDISSDHWQKKTSIPGKGRHFGACAATKSHLYLLGGRYFAGDLTGGEVFDSYLRYTPSQDQWESCGSMPCGSAENLIAFTIAGKAYFGLGENADGHVLNTLYRIEE